MGVGVWGVWIEIFGVGLRLQIYIKVLQNLSFHLGLRVYSVG